MVERIERVETIVIDLIKGNASYLKWYRTFEQPKPTSESVWRYITQDDDSPHCNL